VNKTVHYHDFVDIIPLIQNASIEKFFKKLNFKSKFEYLLPINEISINIDKNFISDCIGKLEEINGKFLFVILDDNILDKYFNESVLKIVSYMKGIIDFEILILSDFNRSKPVDKSIYRILVNKERKEAYYLRHLEKIFENQPLIYQKILKERGGQKGDTGVYKAKKMFFNDLDFKDIKYEEPLEIVCHYKEVSFEIFCIFKPNLPLVVFGQSAVTRPVDLPVFHRWSWIHECNYSTIFINDPTLYLDPQMEGGWLQGKDTHFYLDSYIEIIKSLMNFMNLNAKEVLFFGSSAGGFTSLQMAAKLKGAHALVQIPQIDMTEYHIEQAKDLLYKNCYNSMSIDKIKESYYDRLSVIECFKHLNYIPNIWYLQNTHDVSHLHTQFGFFMKEIAKLLLERPELRENKLIIETYSLNHPLRGGHTVMGKEFTLEYIEKAIHTFINND